MNNLYPLEKEYALIAAFQQGSDRALDRLMRCKSYQKLLQSYASKASRKNSRLEFDDCLSAAALGFVEASKKFDPAQSNGARLGTFARLYIQEQLSQLARAVPIVPISKSKAAVSVFNGISRECRARGWAMSSLSKKQIRELADFFKVTESLLQTVWERIVSSNHADISELEFADDSKSAEDVLEEKQRKELFEKAMAQLDRKQRHAIQRRLEAANFDELGKELGLKREAASHFYSSSLESLQELIKNPRPSSPAVHPARRHIIPQNKKPVQLELFPCAENPNQESSKRSSSGSHRKGSSHGTTRLASGSRSTARGKSHSDFREAPTFLPLLTENLSV